LIDNIERKSHVWDDLEWDIVRLVGEIEATRVLLDSLVPPVPDRRLDSFQDNLSMRRRRFNVEHCTLNIAINDKRGEILQLYSRIGRLQWEAALKAKATKGDDHLEDRYRVPE
jgi:hypothetical protein